LRNLLLGGYGIVVATYLRDSHKPITERQQEEKNVVRSASCAGKGALQGKGGGQFPPPSPWRGKVRGEALTLLGASMCMNGLACYICATTLLKHKRDDVGIPNSTQL